MGERKAVTKRLTTRYKACDQGREVRCLGRAGGPDRLAPGPRPGRLASGREDPSELGSQLAAFTARLPQLNVLGGCCGTGSRHIATIARALASR